MASDTELRRIVAEAIRRADLEMQERATPSSISEHCAHMADAALQAVAWAQIQMYAPTFALLRNWWRDNGVELDP